MNKDLVVAIRALIDERDRRGREDGFGVGEGP